MWKLQYVQPSKHPLIQHYLPNFFHSCKITIRYSAWPSLLISISFFKVFQYIQIKNEIIQIIINWFSKYVDVMIIFHTYTGTWEAVAKTKFFDHFRGISLLSLLILKTSYNFFFCFCYSFIFHIIFDRIFHSQFISSLLNKFDDILNMTLKTNSRSNDNINAFQPNEKNDHFQDEEKLISGNIEF